MPEGDIVWYTARRLHEALAGRVLTRSDFRVPRFATVSLAGQPVTEAVSRGKHLLIRTGGGLTVHTHLKMEGSWRVRPAGDRIANSHRIRLILANDEWQAVGYQLGITEVLRTSREDRVVGHLGPDLLDPDWDQEHLREAVRRLSADPARPVGVALLDQACVAGIGNLYKCEVLFLRGVSPWRPVGEISEPDLEALVSLARRLLDANKARISQVTTGLDRGRGSSTWVYGRRGAPCRRCGTPVRKQDDGRERVTFWCPSCQPGLSRADTLACMRDQTVAEFLSELAARTPVPAGGAAAALSAAQAAALIAMVARYSDGPRHDPVVVGRIRAAADGLVDEAIRLAEADAAAFGEVTAAYRMPKETDEERKIRSGKIAQGLVTASRPPADLMSATARLAGLAEEMLAAANRNVISDLGAAAAAITAAAVTARFNIESNLSGVEDDPLKPELMETAALAPEITDRAARLIDAVRDEIAS